MYKSTLDEDEIKPIIKKIVFSSPWKDSPPTRCYRNDLYKKKISINSMYL